MLVRCWGARGSIPVSGREYLRYGGDTTCIELRTRDDRVVVIDAGSGIRRLGNRLLAEGKAEIDLLFTHAHWDHLLGFPFFKPLYEKSATVNVSGCPCAQMSVEAMVSRAMAPPNFPIPLAGVQAAMSFYAHCDDTFALGGLTVTPITISHPNGGLGYRVVEDGRSFVFLTDNELGFQHPHGGTLDDYVEFCAGADLLIHDAEFTPDEYAETRGWGHATFADAVELALRADVKALGLFHHNQDRTDDQVDEIVEACRRIVARSGAELECFAAAQGMERAL